LISDPNLIVGLERADDAGVYKLSDELAIIQTLDFVTPIVDDPYTFGQVAAANALSDVYAMGGRPLVAMNIVCFPTKTMDISVLEEILAGKMIEAGFQTPYGKPPWWTAGATPQQIEDYRNRVGGPIVNIQTGQELMTAGQRQDLADEQYRKTTQPTRTDRTAFANTAFGILGTLPQRRWKAGRYNYSRQSVNQGYEQYLNETGYQAANENTKKAIRDSWYGLMKQIKQTGLQTRNFSVGKNEIDWDPSDAKIKQLEGRRPAATGRPEGGRIESPSRPTFQYSTGGKKIVQQYDNQTRQPFQVVYNEQGRGEVKMLHPASGKPVWVRIEDYKQAKREGYSLAD